MRQFYEAYCDTPILSALLRESQPKADALVKMMRWLNMHSAAACHRP